jgi:hypothetical protein
LSIPDLFIDDDLTFTSDSAVITFGADGDTTLTHTDGTGLTLNGTNKLTFGDVASFVQQSSDGVLRIDGEATIDLNASTAVTVSNDLKLDSDSAVLGFGADNDTTLTHTDGSGLTLNSTNKIMFNDASQFIQGSSATVLSLGATDEIDLTATAIDVNGTLDVSGAITSSAGATITVADNSDVLHLKSTDDDANVGPVLLLNRVSSNAADSDVIGSIDFDGRNDAGQAVEYAQIIAQILDASDGTEDGALYLQTIHAGTKRERVSLLDTETVLNNAAVDLDFRVESDGNTHMLFVDAGNNRLGIGDSAPLSSVVVNGGRASEGVTAGGSYTELTRASGGDLGLLFNKDTSKWLVGIDNSNGNAGPLRFEYGDYTASAHPGLGSGVLALSLTYQGGITNTPVAGGHSVFNEGGVDADFRVETDARSHGFFVDASTDNAGFMVTPVTDSLSSFNAVQFGQTGLIQSRQAAQSVSFNDNVYRASSGSTGYKAIVTGSSSMMTMNGGEIAFYSNANASAGADVTLHNSFTISNNITYKGKAGTSPIFNLVNSDSEDVNTGRESSIRFSGFRSGGESVDNAQISGNHVGGADDDLGGMLFYTNGGSGLGERLRIDNDQIVVNEDGNDQNFRIESASDSVCFFVDAGNNTVCFGSSTPQQAARFFTTVGTSKPGYLTQNLTTGSTNNVAQFMSNGESVIGTINATNTATAYNTSSDYRLKENVETLKDGLGRVNQLKPVQFTWTTDGSLSEGFIAHEVDEIFSDAVSGEKDAVDDNGDIDPQQVDYGRITPLLVKAIQEQQEQIEELKVEVAKLKGE